jgi:ABC-type Fe3+ transport system permease subunit
MEGGLVKALFKSSLIASAVFAAAWFRIPPTEIIRNFIFYGILITIFSLVLGLPLAWLIERLKIGRWWSYLAFAAATGALLGAILSSHPSVESRAAPTAGSGEQETSVENPFAITFSPWTRSQPGFA